MMFTPWFKFDWNLSEWSLQSLAQITMIDYVADCVTIVAIYWPDNELQQNKILLEFEFESRDICKRYLKNTWKIRWNLTLTFEEISLQRQSSLGCGCVCVCCGGGGTRGTFMGPVAHHTLDGHWKSRSLEYSYTPNIQRSETSLPSSQPLTLHTLWLVSQL